MTTVLLIEDNSDDIELAHRAFEKAGMADKVRVVMDGTEALEYLLGPDDSPSQAAASSIKLILLDLNLPKTPGLAVLRRIRLNPATRHIPVVILTVSRKEPDLLQSFTMGISDYLIKPLEADRFIQIYKKYVRTEPA